MPEKIILTKEGYEKLQKEYREYIDVIKPQVIQELKEARAQGDLSENADYDAARDRQAQVEAKIRELQYKIENAQVIEAESSNDVVAVGYFVTFKDSLTGKDEKYQIVGSTESDPDNNKISNECLLARTILGHKVGETITIKAPKQYDVTILSVTAD